jgi:hypothetical protein
MDPELTRHYRAAQRDPVFTRTAPMPRPPARPLWPYLIYAAVLGAALVFTSTIIVQQVQENMHHVIR